MADERKGFFERCKAMESGDEEMKKQIMAVCSSLILRGLLLTLCDSLLML